MARLCAKYQNVWITEICVMDEWYFARLDLKVSFGGYPILQHPPWSDSYITHTCRQTLQWRHNERLKSPASRLFTQPFIQSTYQREHQSSASLAFVRGIHRWLVNFPHKGPVTRKMFPFDDVIMGMYVHSMTVLTLESSNEIDYVLNQYPRPVI